jgi:phage regulator Rha-like protein
MAKTIVIPDEVIINRIYLIRGQKIMLDRDLAELYGVETKALKQAVRRNLTRFPEDFMFEMSDKELALWRNENATSKADIMGLRYPPFCFTEQGVTMLSCVLNSERSIEVNILIIRIFTRLRELLLTHKDILLKLEQMERKMLKRDERTNKHEEEIQLIFSALKQLIDSPRPPRKRIGFKTSQDDEVG